MEIRVYRHELEYCNVFGNNISDNDIEHICNTLKIDMDYVEYDYDTENNELIFYYDPLP